MTTRPVVRRALRGVAASCVVAVALFASGCSSPPDGIDKHLDAGVAAVSAVPSDGDAFGVFRVAVAEAAAVAGDQALADRVIALEPGRDVPADARRLASRLLRKYVVARYGDRIVEDLIEIISFRTYAEPGRENWDAPEFVRQTTWLREKSEALGMTFRSFDGRVDEVSLSGGPRVLGVLTHGDVQGVEGQTWSSPPWEPSVVDGKIVGRGTEDDKGPIVTALYVFAALRDSGWPLGAGLRLMIANGEESSWEEIPYYLERQTPPDVTLGFDASYPVTYAQKAWASWDVQAAGDVPSVPDSEGWQVLGVSGGSGLSIIAERGEALLRAPDRGSAESLRAAADAWSSSNPPARLVVEEATDGIRLVAHGRGGHSSVPSVGHNAFGDLMAFLATQPLVDDDWGALVRCMGKIVGTDIYGRTLGVAVDDPVLGPLTLNLALFDVHEGRPRARSSLRVPRGIDADTIRRRLADQVERVGSNALGSELDMDLGPHWVAPDGPLVQTLLDVWEEVTGKPGRPVAIGGGTQARLFPDGVDFGPAVAMERYRGHGPDEYVTVDELERNAELTIAALWALAK